MNPCLNPLTQLVSLRATAQPRAWVPHFRAACPGGSLAGGRVRRGGLAVSAAQMVIPLLLHVFSPSGLALSVPDDPGVSPDPGSGNGGKYPE